jgi:hypothetical protein
MGDVVKFMFMPVGLGGLGVDFTESRPLKFWQGPKDQAAPVYDADAEKKKAEEAASNQVKKKRLEQTQTVNTSALGNTGKVNTGKTVLGG